MLFLFHSLDENNFSSKYSETSLTILLAHQTLYKTVKVNILSVEFPVFQVMLKSQLVVRTQFAFVVSEIVQAPYSTTDLLVLDSVSQ